MPWDMPRLTVREYRLLIQHMKKQEQERLNGL